MILFVRDFNMQILFLRVCMRVIVTYLNITNPRFFCEVKNVSFFLTREALGWNEVKNSAAYMQMLKTERKKSYEDSREYRILLSI